MIRIIYNVCFWAGVAVLLFMAKDSFVKDIYPQAEEVIGPFAYVLSIIGGFALLFGLNYLREAISNTALSLYSMTTHGGTSLLSGNTSRHALVRNALRLKRRKDFGGAAEVYESLESWPEAAECFSLAGLFHRAAIAYERAGEKSKAVELYEADENYDEAARVCLDEGLRDRAARNYRAAGEKAYRDNSFLKAAGYFEQAGDHERAGGIFEQMNRDEDALRNFEAAGNAAKIEELLDKLPVATLVTKGEQHMELIRRCTERLAALGKAGKAAELFEATGDIIRAAEVYEQVREYDRAGECYLRADRVERAKACYERVSDPEKVADFKARVASAEGDFVTAGRYFAEAQKPNQAIEMFKRAKDFKLAGEVYEGLKRYLLAGEMYATAKEFRHAAEAYARGHDWRNAAECYEAAGDNALAMEAQASAGDFYRAGMLAKNLGQYPQAMDYLQRVPNTSPDYLQSQGQLGGLFVTQNRPDIARGIFDKIMDRMRLTPDNLDVFFHYATLIEYERPDNALAIYRQILSIDIAYAGVHERIKAVEQAMYGGVPQPSVSAGGLPSFPDQSGASRQPAATAQPYAPAPPPVQPPQPPYRQEGQAPAAPAWSPAPPIAQPPMPPVRPSSPHMASSPPVSDGIDSPGLEAGYPKPQAAYFAPSRNITQLPDTTFGDDGRYRILEEIGRSGSGIVYRAHDENLQREVALKTFPLSKRLGPGHEDIFLTTVRQIARLAHPNIALVYDCGHVNYLYYVAMELVAGDNMRDYVKRKGPLAMDVARSIIARVADALLYAHSQQVLHLDLKPFNIYLRSGKDVRITDFGLAKLLTDAHNQDSADGLEARPLVTTPEYTPPELILGNAVDGRADIYSLGLTMFYLLTGRTPFELKKLTDEQEIARYHLSSAFPRPSTLRATLPPKVDEVFVRCTQKNPDDRYAAVTDFLAEFRAI